MSLRYSLLIFSLFAIGCSAWSTSPIPGSDKQAEGTLYGAGTGAGAGAITAAQVSSTLGPGMWIGAGFGSIFGLFSGLGMDVIEEDQLRMQEETQCLQEKNWAQAKLAEHYAKRLELYPNRDIFPADWFFHADSAKLHPGGEILAKMLADINQHRMPWSRIMVTAYNTSTDPESSYANYVTRKRAEAIAFEFIHAGFEPRRVLVQSAVIPKPLVVDPNDDPGRYQQAIEFIALDY